MKTIFAEIERYLPHQVVEKLKEIGSIADSRGEKAYLVGGTVRDIFLRQRSLDLDIAVEGKAIVLARHIGKNKNLPVKTHPRFGTATLAWGDITLDLVTARSEVYPQPGALPVVKWGSIEDDLRRRDFTINAMAVSLRPMSFGELLDPHGGLSDLEEGVIRVLHRGSFADDPTRILRALRYEQRLGFALERTTEEMVRQGLLNLDTVTGERLWNELVLILKEDWPERALCRADALGVLGKLCPAWRGDSWLAEKFAFARGPNDESLNLSVVYLAILSFRLSVEEVEACIARLKMPGWAARTMRGASRLDPSLSNLAAPDLRPSEVYHHLCQYPPEVIHAAAVASEIAIIKERLERWLDSSRYVKTSLKGEDLQKLGVSPGNAIGRMLRLLHDARLDGTVENREEEVLLVREILATQ